MFAAFPIDTAFTMRKTTRKRREKTTYDVWQRVYSRSVPASDENQMTSQTVTDTYRHLYILTYCDGAFFMGGVDVVKGSLRSQTMRPGCKSSKFTAFRLGMVENVQKNDWKILECSDMFGKYACIMCVHMQPPASKSEVAFART